MELAEPLLAARRRSVMDAGSILGRWYDPDSASFIDDQDPDAGPAMAADAAGRGDYSPLKRGGRFSMKAASPSA
jgi:hypothetical protein